MLPTTLIFSRGPSVEPPERRGENGGNPLDFSEIALSGKELIITGLSNLANCDRSCDASHRQERRKLLHHKARFGKAALWHIDYVAWIK